MLSLIGYLIFKNTTLLMIDTSITGIAGGGNLSKDFIKNIKSLNLNNYKSNSNIINAKQEKDVDKILQKGIGKAKGEDFYNEKYKFTIKKEEAYAKTEEQKEYKKALEKQQKQINKNLYYLENQEIEKQEIEILQQDILSKLPSTKIINFSDYTTRKRRK